MIPCMWLICNKQFINVIWLVYIFVDEMELGGKADAMPVYTKGSKH